MILNRVSADKMTCVAGIKLLVVLLVLGCLSFLALSVEMNVIVGNECRQCSTENGNICCPS